MSAQGRLRRRRHRSPHHTDATASKLASLALLGLLGGAWSVSVAGHVADPYLDEYFHVRQALAYWQGRWDVWDAKITTPPGLYAASWAWLLLLRRLGPPCALLTQLRAVNQLVGIPGIVALVPGVLRRVCVQELRLPGKEGENGDGDGDDDGVDDGGGGGGGGDFAAGVWATARNVAVFPPLFFFSALYYTDVLSVLLVLLCYRCFLGRRPWAVVLVGVASLLFRQNNIFWVAVYLGGLEVVRSLEVGDTVPIAAWSDISSTVRSNVENGTFHNPDVDLAGVEDYVICVVTLAYASLVNLPRVIGRLLPYVVVLGLFGAFVVWNGGVVLGDKSNHVASLHLPQMLYIWAYFAFFSFPILLLALMSKLVTAQKSPFVVLPRPLIFIAFSAAALLAVRYNTVIHPFTLADNRHYTFYVFRLLRLYPFLRYAAVPVYIVGAWLALIALGTAKGVTEGLGTRTKQDRKDKKATTPATGSNRVAFVIVWAISAALGLVTAPLVEPRYFILPWMFWRLHVPPSQLMVPASDKRDRDTAGHGAVRWLASNALTIETAWLVAVNAVTMYIFIYWGFTWLSEPGATQRFMW